MMLIKALHISCVLLSISGFILRGVWMIRQSPLLQRRWVKIAPHIIDSFLLVTGLTLALQWQYTPLQQPWLMAKIIALFCYIIFGSIALKRGKTLAIRVLTWLVAIMIFSYIAAVALSKSPSVFFLN